MKLSSHFLFDETVGCCQTVNFTKVLCAAITLLDPESVKKIDNLTVFFALLGSARVKVISRTLMKLIPGLMPEFPESGDHKKNLWH